jgi:hypothetical protein
MALATLALDAFFNPKLGVLAHLQELLIQSCGAARF